MNRRLALIVGLILGGILISAALLLTPHKGTLAPADPDPSTITAGPH